MRRHRQSRILATLGPSSSTPERIRALVDAGADVFRLNFSHGSHEDHAERLRMIRDVERETGRPIGVLMDLQGPKLRIGKLTDGKVQLAAGSRFRLDLDLTPGDAARANLPHPEIFAALEAGTELLLDDGKLRLRVEAFGADFADTTVLVGGPLSDRKGVNVPGVVLPISPLTAKDLADLDFGLSLGVDWVALSFVQRPEDIREARRIVGERAWIMAKLEKPAAIERLDEIVALADGVMVARRPRRRNAARAGADPAAAHRPGGAGGRSPRRGRDADARVDDHRAGADARRSLGRRDRDPRRRRRGDAVGRIRVRPVSRRKR